MSEAYTLMHIPMRLVETVQGIASGALVAVPREPTVAMTSAAYRTEGHSRSAAAIYRAMLAASEAPRHD